MKMTLTKLDSPLGQLLLVTDDDGVLRALDFADHQARFRRIMREHYGTDYELVEGAPKGVAAQALERYFAGDLEAIEQVPTGNNGTEFQRKVWKALDDIPVGSTTSYGALAKALGYDDPRAAIDIGAAVGANPVAVFVPCHRVIAKDGGLKGYAGGLHRKQWLLEHEHAIAPAVEARPPEELSLPGF